MNSDERALQRLRDLDARLRLFKAEVEPPAAAHAARPIGPGLAFEIAGHLVAGPLLGGTIGYYLDQWLNTGPWFLVLMFFMGAAAGFVNVYRSVTGIGLAVGYRPSSPDRVAARGGDGGGAGEQDVTQSEDKNGKSARPI